MDSGSTWDMIDDERLLLWSLTGFILMDVDLGFSVLANLEACVDKGVCSTSSVGNGIDSVILLSSSEEAELSLEWTDLLSELFTAVDMVLLAMVEVVNCI